MSLINKEKFEVGDFVKLWEGCYGIIVASSEDPFFINKYPKSIWEGIDEGLLILSSEIGLTHYPKNEQLLFIRHYEKKKMVNMNQDELKMLLINLTRKVEP